MDQVESNDGTAEATQQPKDQVETTDGTAETDQQPEEASYDDVMKQKASERVQARKEKKRQSAELPSQEEAEKATQQGIQEGEQAAQNAGQQKNTWSSYVPSLGWSSGKKEDGTKGAETEQQKNSRTWGSYFPSGKGFSNYVPKSASNTVSSFAATVRALRTTRS